jgi:hypothetical protein
VNFAELVEDAIKALTLALLAFGTDPSVAADLLRTATERVQQAQDVALDAAGIARGRR